MEIQRRLKTKMATIRMPNSNSIENNERCYAMMGAQLQMSVMVMCPHTYCHTVQTFSKFNSRRKLLKRRLYIMSSCWLCVITGLYLERSQHDCTLEPASFYSLMQNPAHWWVNTMRHRGKHTQWTHKKLVRPKRSPEYPAENSDQCQQGRKGRTPTATSNNNCYYSSLFPALLLSQSFLQLSSPISLYYFQTNPKWYG